MIESHPDRRSLFLAACCLALATGFTSAQSSPELGAAPEQLQLEGGTEVPMDLSSGRPIVQVRIEDGSPTSLVFDTGGVGLMIDADLAEEIGLEIVGMTRVSSPLGDPGGIELQQARIDRLELGGATLKGLLVDLWSAEPLFRSHNPPRGVFGITLLRGTLVTLDFPNERLLIQEGALPEAGPGIVNLEDDQGLPVVPVYVAGTRVLAHLDSGNPGKLHLPIDLKGRLPLRAPAVLAGRARTVDAVVEIYAGTIAGPVTIAGHHFEDLEVHFVEGATWANVGLDLLRDFEVTIDLQHHRARIHRPGDRRQS